MQQVIVSQQLPRIQNVSCILTPTNGKGGLYLGNYFGAQNVVNLKAFGIRAVLTTSIETPVSYNPQDIPFHKKIAAHDRPNFSMMEYLDQCVRFIEEFREMTNVYVHCYAGMSRSTTMIIAYLMKTFKWGFDATLSFVRFKRSIANPNQGFVIQLRQYQKILGIASNPGIAPEQKLSKSQVVPITRQVQQQLPPPRQSLEGYHRRVIIASPQQQLSTQMDQLKLSSVLNKSFNSMNPKNHQTQVVGQRPQLGPQTMRQLKTTLSIRHDQIPIPKFISKQQFSKKSISQIKPKQIFKPKFNSQRQVKSGFIKPKDLPGYKQ